MSKYKIIEGKEVTKADIEQAIMLDRAIYDEEYYVSLEQCLSWYNANDQIYTMVRDEKTNVIVAYVNISPVTEEYYERIKSGEFIDAYLPAEAIVAFDFPDMYDLYFSSIVIHPDYQNTGIFKPLFDAIVKKIIKFGKNEVFFRRMVADAVTEKGVKFCQLFGMSRIGSSNHNSTLYEVQLVPPDFRVSSQATKELFDFYQDKVLDLKSSANNLKEHSQIMNRDRAEINKEFAVFLSYKNTDSRGMATRDSYIALELYNALMNRGINTFFSNTTLEILGAAQYKQVIDEALDKSKVLIAIGTSVDNLNSQWVRYEWDSFSNDILSGLKPGGAVFSYIDVITPHMLPRTLRQSQVFEKASCSYDDVCNYIENSLGIGKHKKTTVNESRSSIKETYEVTFQNVFKASVKMFKKSFQTFIEYDKSVIQKNVDNYSALFSLITRIKTNGKSVDAGDNFINSLINEIYHSSSENILKIVGNNGSEKNALMQLLYILIYDDAISGKNEFVPFYINLPFYEKKVYDSGKSITAQIEKEMKNDLGVFIDYIKMHPHKKPLIFIDGIRDFIFSKTSIEHILSDVLSNVHNLHKVVSVDINFTENKKRIKKVIALAPTNFEYIAKIESVDLADDSLCKKFFAAVEKIHGIEVVSLYSKLQKISFYEIDAYILRLSADILRDNLDNDAFTISDLYEAMCLEMFNGNRVALMNAAKAAYDFSYTEIEFDDADVFSAKHWTLIKRHKSFVDFLISYYYIYKLTKFEDDWDVPFFELVLPKEVTRFVTPRLNDTYGNEEKVIKLVKKHYSEMGVLGKSEMTFWLGRLKNPRLALEARQLLKSLYDDIINKIDGEENRTMFSDDISQRKTELFLLRGITVSLIYGGMDKISDEYIVRMIDEDLPNTINRGFHLEYYGDKPYLPNKDMLDFEDDVKVGKKTFKRLTKNIEQHLSKKTAAPLLELDLFTLCSLIQARISNRIVGTSFPLDDYITICIEFLSIYKSRIMHVNNKKIFSYFNMIYDDLKKYKEHPSETPIFCDTYNQYRKICDVKRTGWIDMSLPEPESVAEHMYNTWLLGMMYLPERYSDDDYSKSKIMTMIMIHDLGETITGDIPKPKKKESEEFDQKEDYVMRSLLLKGTYPGLTNLKEYYLLWDEWYGQVTINSRIAKDLDTLQAMYQFCVYFLKYPEKIPLEKKDSWLDEYKELKTDLGFEIYEQVIKKNTLFRDLMQ